MVFWRKIDIFFLKMSVFRFTETLILGKCDKHNHNTSLYVLKKTIAEILAELATQTLQYWTDIWPTLILL